MSRFTVCAVIAAAILALAMPLDWRFLAAPWVPVVLLALGAAAAGVAVGADLRARVGAAGWDVLVFVVALAFCLVWMATLPSIYIPRKYPPLPPVAGVFGAGGVVAVVAARVLPRAIRWAAVAATAAAAGALMGWAVVNSPDPGIDTYAFEIEACHALTSGQNPYAVTMPNIYGAAEGERAYYDPGEVSGDRVLRGYSYPPLSLFVLLPAYVAHVDIRCTFAVAMLLIAGLLFWVNRTKAGSAIAVLMLLCPFNVEMVCAAWTEAFTVLLLAATAVAAARRWRGWPLWLGLFLASKQYGVLFLPAALFLVPQPWSVRAVLRCLIPALVVAAVVTLPLVLWDWRAYYHSTVAYLFHVQPRRDSLGVTILIARALGIRPPGFVAYLMLLAAYALCFRRLRPAASSFCVCVGLASTTLFAFNRLAFVNYYFLPIVALLLAATLREVEERAAPAPQPGAPAAGEGTV